MSEVTLTSANFQSEVLDHEGYVLVDFWASWCGPCKMLAPVVSQIAEENEGTVKVCKLNTDDVMDVAVKYGISAIPTLILFKNGEVVDKTVGVVPKAAIEAMWKK